MKTLKVTSARNKSLVGKSIFFNENTGIAKMGRTEYKVQFGTHQPNIDKGNYQVEDYKLEDLKMITLYKVGNANQNTGIPIAKYKLI